MSEKLSNMGLNKEIIFKAEFNSVRRIKKHSIVFLATPNQVKIEIS